MQRIIVSVLNTNARFLVENIATARAAFQNSTAHRPHRSAREAYALLASFEYLIPLQLGV